MSIYNALNPDWWILQPSLWNTDYYSTQIDFETAGGTHSYISSAPYQTLNSGTAAPTTQLNSFIDSLRTEAAQRLYDMHCTSVTGAQALTYVFGAQA